MVISGVWLDKSRRRSNFKSLYDCVMGIFLLLLAIPFFLFICFYFRQLILWLKSRGKLWHSCDKPVPLAVCDRKLRIHFASVVEFPASDKCWHSNISKCFFVGDGIRYLGMVGYGDHVLTSYFYFSGVGYEIWSHIEILVFICPYVCSFYSCWQSFVLNSLYFL